MIYRKNAGYIATITTVLIGAVVIAVVITMTILSVGQVQSALALSLGEMELDVTEGCMEEALLHIASNASYAGGTMIHPEGSCAVVVSKNGSEYTVTSSSVNTSYQRNIRVVCTRSASNVLITSWTEL